MRLWNVLKVSCMGIAAFSGVAEGKRPLENFELHMRVIQSIDEAKHPGWVERAYLDTEKTLSTFASDVAEVWEETTGIVGAAFHDAWSVVAGFIGSIITALFSSIGSVIADLWATVMSFTLISTFIERLDQIAWLYDTALGAPLVVVGVGFLVLSFLACISVGFEKLGPRIGWTLTITVWPVLFIFLVNNPILIIPGLFIAGFFGNIKSNQNLSDEESARGEEERRREEERKKKELEKKKNAPLCGSYVVESMILGEDWLNPMNRKAARKARNLVLGRW